MYSALDENVSKVILDKQRNYYKRENGGAWEKPLKIWERDGKMAEILEIIAFVINGLHDYISQLVKVFKLDVNDKDLHFWIIGGIGILLFLLTDAVFKRISRWNISVLSFIYTFTVLIVLVFGLEIEQKITGRGNMEFKDIVYGLWGFIEIFSIYLGLRIVVYLIKRYVLKRTQYNRGK